jgi:hypothetical protein
MPQDLKIEIDQLSREQATTIAEYWSQSSGGRMRVKWTEQRVEVGKRSWRSTWTASVAIDQSGRELGQNRAVRRSAARTVSCAMLRVGSREYGPAAPISIQNDSGLPQEPAGLPMAG